MRYIFIFIFLIVQLNSGVFELLNGLDNEYYSNGKIKKIIEYKNNTKTKRAKYYDISGKLIKEVNG